MMNKDFESTFIALTPSGGPSLSFLGANLAFKVSGAETNGTWALIEHTLPPHFKGAPLHWHKVTRQGFYVIEGKVMFQLDGQVFSGEPGAFVSVPPRLMHTFNNALNQPAKLLEIIVPSGLEVAYKELIALTQSEPTVLLHPHKLIEINKRYDTFMSDEK